MKLFKALPVISDILPLIGYYKGLPKPEGRTYRTRFRDFRKFSDLIRTNDKGQVINLARNTGTDNKNVQDLYDSFKVNGVAVSQELPFVGTNDKLYDGFSRCKALEKLKFDGWYFNVIEPKDGFTWADVWAEVGLGANNHLPNKKAETNDFVTGLSHYIESCEELPTQGQCVDWVNDIPHQFNQSEVAKIADQALKNHRTYATMESFTASEVLTKVKNEGPYTNRVSIIPLNISGKLSYFQRCVFNVLEQIKNPRKDENRVYAFTNKIPSDQVAEVRKAAKKKEDEINDLFEAAFQARMKQGKRFKLLHISHWVGQIIGEEDGFIPVGRPTQ